jgi:peptidoglycan/xylan/chitin deacetylase (PgdA/CDA1 family)
MSMGTRDQAYMDRTEVEVAIEYAEIAAEYNVPVTLFLTGKTAVEEPEHVERLAAMDNVEIGGHNYWAFTTPIHKGWRAVEMLSSGVVGSWSGPRPFQRYEIRRTISLLNEHGADVTAWRDHAYRHDRYTPELLADVGITHFSDVLGPDERVREEDGVTVVPVNTPPDHEHVYHAFRTPGSETVVGFQGPFGGRSVPIEEWVEWTVERIEAVRSDGSVATVLAHPACQWLADRFNSFEDLVIAVSDKEVTTMCESTSNAATYV